MKEALSYQGLNMQEGEASMGQTKSEQCGIQGATCHHGLARTYEMVSGKQNGIWELAVDRELCFQCNIHDS